MNLLIVVDHDRGEVSAPSLDALRPLVALASRWGVEAHALTLGEAADGAAGELGKRGIAHVIQVHDPLLGDYGPETWGQSVAALIADRRPVAVLTSGTDRGNEVLAQAAARSDLPFAANILGATRGSPWTVVRQRWGGSLHDRSTVDAPVLIATWAHPAPEAAPLPGGAAREPTSEVFHPRLDPRLARSTVTDRAAAVAGVTLATATVVVGGGRGVGSAEGFAPLEDLARLLGGAVGCSRAVTNNGWRNHSDQVGQTGTRISPELYIACGISGAIQHWIGAAGARRVLAVNTDPEANMVARADWAVIGDLHEVVPAITAEVERRRSCEG